ncbi:MAG: histidine kinase N-terminal 7TM domain-containing protein [Candidatus Cryosericum sp.]
MSVQMTPYSLPLIIAACLSAAVAWQAWHKQPSPGARTFSVLMMFVVANIIVSFFLLGSTNLPAFLFWIKMSFVGGGLGVAWLAFALRYAGRPAHTMFRLSMLLAIEPFVVFVLAWFNDFHHLLWTSAVLAASPVAGSALRVDSSFGPLFWVWNAYQYALLLAGFVLLIHSLVRSAPAYRGQTLAVLTAMVLPWTANILFVIGVTPVTHVDLTPFTFALSGLALFLALFRFRFLDLVPITRSYVLEVSPNGVLVLDGRGRVVDINPAAESILGCSGRDVLGKPGTQVLPALGSVGGGPDADLTFVQDGAERSYHLHVAPLRKHSGQLVLLMDVTDQKLMTTRLLQAQKMDALGLMAGGIAHDFNNLLTGILGNLSIMKEQAGGNTELVDSLAQSEQAARRAADLTHSLLAFSRNGSSAPSVMNLNQSVDLTMQAIARVLPPSVTVTRDFAPDLWNVLADPIQITQLVINLVVNGRDAMHGSGTLTLRTANAWIDDQFAAAHPEARTGDHVMLAVTDTGEGMSDEVRQHLFEPFFTTKPMGHGTGLGLSVVYGAVHQAKGWILVDTAVGQGTVFSVYLPRCLEQIRPVSVPSSTSHDRRGNHETVLVVDDEDMILQLTRRMLEHGGYNVVTACDGSSAISLVGESPKSVDLVLLDMTMPGMTGDQVLWELRRLGCAAPILISSGYSLGGGIQELVGAPGGADGFLPKPYNVQQLAEAVGAALENTRIT